MRKEIKNPVNDEYGNSKNNIFLAFNDEGDFLGSSYVYPNMNHSQIEEIPYLIFIDINLEESLDKKLGDKVRQELFDRVYLRAKELRTERSDVKARIYSGFSKDMDYVLPEMRKKGIGKIILRYIFNYFLENGLERTRLEVWELNRFAVRLYKSFGYKEVEKNLMFPGINL